MYSLFEVDELIRGAGAQRVDERASRKLNECLEDSAKEILRRARIYAKHAKRSRINGRDIKLAAKDFSLV